jgi:uncharacterized phage protein (TIGR02218 family)
MNLCVKIGDLLLTNHRQNIEIEAEIYVSNPSLEIIYSDKTNNFEREKLLLKLSNFSRDLRVLQGKRIEVFYFNLQEKAKFQGQKMIISKVSSNEESFFFELASLSEIFGLRKMNYFSENCRASFGDAACKIELKDFMFEGKIDGFSKDFLEIYDADLEPENPGDFKYGKLVLEGFLNEELLIFKLESKRIVLLLESHVELKIGMKYKVFMGCDKTLKTCIERYQNAINFRGEPFIFEKFPSSSF